MHSYDRVRLQMVERLRARGISDPRVLEAMALIPREQFVGPAFAAQAYQESALPIAEGQTISQPLSVAQMTQALRLKPTDSVLEIGTGSGYQAAVLSRLVRRVCSIERHLGLSRSARQLLEAAGCRNILFKTGDGTLGWRELAPFDAIVVTACGPDVPPALVEQLAMGGRLVMPINAENGQRLVCFTQTPKGLEAEDMGEAHFVPLIGRFGWDKAAMPRALGA